MVGTGPQQAAAEVAAQAAAAAEERAPLTINSGDTIITRTPQPPREAEPVRMAVEPNSVGARYARLYGQMQTGNYDEAQIKHPTNDMLRERANAEQLQADQKVVLSTLSKLEQMVTERQPMRTVAPTIAETISARLNTGANAVSAPSVGADFDYSAVPDSGLVPSKQPTGTVSMEAETAPQVAERAPRAEVKAQGPEVVSHASATDVKQTKEYLAAQAQEYRAAQDLAQEKEQAEKTAAQFLAEQEQEQEQLERKAAELALAQDQAEAAAEQALATMQAAQSVSAPNSVTGAPSIIASQGSSILNPGVSDKVGTASDFNRLYREAMQSEARQRTEQRVELDQTVKEHHAKVANDTLTLTQQRVREDQAVGSSQVNTVGDTNIRAVGSAIASATTTLTAPKLATTVVNQPTPEPAPASNTPASNAPTSSTPATSTTGSATTAATSATGAQALSAQTTQAPTSPTLTNAVNQAAPQAANQQPGAPLTTESGVKAAGAVTGTAAVAGTAAAGNVNVGSATAPLGLDEESLQDEIIRNVMRTVPSDDLDEFNLRASQPLSGVIADTDLTSDPNVSAMPQTAAPSFSVTAPLPELSTVVPNERTAGAAGVSAGQNAPIPEQSVVSSYEAPQEGGLLRRLAALFGRSSTSTEPPVSQGQTASVAASALGGLKREEAQALAQEPVQAQTEILHALEQERQEALRQNSLDQLCSRLTQAAGNSNLPEPMQQQARKLLAALENPVADLHTVSNWLNFVTGPLSPSSSQALALHQWAFMLLCIRFEQIGRSVDKFLKKQGKGTTLGDNLSELEPALRQAKEVAKGLEGSKSELTGAHHTSAQLLDETLGQIERLQQQMQLTPPEQVLPRYIPLPPFYHGGKEGSLSAHRHTDEDGGKSWHLNFNFDLENMGALEVKVKLRFPEVQMSFVAERLETLQKVQSLMPELNRHLAQMGLQAKGSNARLGHISHAAEPVSTDFRYEGANFTTRA